MTATTNFTILSCSTHDTEHADHADTDGAVDGDLVIIVGADEYLCGVTLVPRACDGQLDIWWNEEEWADEETRNAIAAGTDPARLVHAIIQAVRSA